MRNVVLVSAIWGLMTFVPLVQCQDPPPPPPPVPQDSLFTPDQLDNLLAPVALYPDPLLAQILVSATYPDQVDEAARFVRGDANPNDIDGQNWDVSVKSVAHYPSVLNMMDDQLDWTTSLGQAYVNQPDDVMAAVQRLRQRAQSVGNLQSNADMQVVDDNGDIDIWPAQPQYLYVPDYDPALVYVQACPFSFGTGFAIGAWLNIDFDWHAHRIFYHGWGRNAGWIQRSKPYVHRISAYVNNRYKNVTVDRTVVSHSVNSTSLNRFESVHANAGYERVRPANPVANSAPANRAPVNNKIIDRNINTNDARINNFRGHETAPAPAPQPRQPANPQPKPEKKAAPPRQQPAPSAFSGNRGNFSANESSARGQASRQSSPRPAPAPRAAPAPRSAPAPASRGGRR